jgi:2-dehydro-3-deoxyphosphogluconate aldolase / (4S)-4-hydroxy-2-oxoglutarate aldolase
VVEICRRYSVPVMPGALTPTEVVTAWSAGADVVKVFPCGALGGASYIKSLKAPLPQIEMIPTGGVSVKTAADFIKAGALALGVGADLVDTKAVREGKAALVTEKAREYLRLVREARTSP